MKLQQHHYSDFKSYLEKHKTFFDAALDFYLPPVTTPPHVLHEAMRYSLLAGGKRLRPFVCREAAMAIRDDVAGIEAVGWALEFVHTFSLIHDDLPAIDNDDFRRGKLTCHKKFGEAVAILAGDALLNQAYQTLAMLDGVSAHIKIQLFQALIGALSSKDGLVGGEMLDIEGERKVPTSELLFQIHYRKTGALFKACLRMGALYAGASTIQCDALSAYGEHIGLAFQITDDVLDIEQPTEVLGKTSGKDVAQHKITFPAVFGLEQSKAMAREEITRAHQALEVFGARAQWLHELADFILYRSC